MHAQSNLGQRTKLGSLRPGTFKSSKGLEQNKQIEKSSFGMCVACKGEIVLTWLTAGSLASELKSYFKSYF